MELKRREAKVQIRGPGKGKYRKWEAERRMAVIARSDVMPVNFLKKENFTGSDRGMRYRMEKGEENGEAVLTVTAWPEPYGFDATPDEKKIRETFAFSEEGIEKGVEWLNRMKEERFGGDEEGKALPANGR